MYLCIHVFSLIIVPIPSFAFILQSPLRYLLSGETVTLTCSSVTPDTIMTPVLAVVQWTLDDDGESIPDTPRLSIGPTLTITPAVFFSTLIISPVLVNDNGVYSCRVYFIPDGELSEYLRPGIENSLTAQQELFISSK